MARDFFHLIAADVLPHLRRTKLKFVGLEHLLHLMWTLIDYDLIMVEIFNTSSISLGQMPSAYSSEALKAQA